MPCQAQNRAVGPEVDQQTLPGRHIPDAQLAAARKGILRPIRTQADGRRVPLEINRPRLLARLAVPQADTKRIPGKDHVPIIAALQASDRIEVATERVAGRTAPGVPDDG